MIKNIHEIRDPIHVFIKHDLQERQVLDSKPFQRLRHINQLALTYLLYPGATHKRFEHSLGVMELASRIFDVVTHPEHLSDNIRDLFPEINDPDKCRYWRRVLRISALCHDIGHLPFSHAGEKELLPKDWNHERITRELILSSHMKTIWDNLEPPLKPEHIVKLALGKKKTPDLEFTDWEIMLAEIIVGDAFGADRMDYLLRDSFHTGVAYGKFDHFRLIDTLRILPPPASGDEEGETSNEPSLGVEGGGMHSAEALLLARYFMFSQVYFHHIRRIYDIHLKDFLLDWLEQGEFSTEPDEFLLFTDAEITSALRRAASDTSQPGNKHAERIIKRKHFKVVYERNSDDIKKNVGVPVASLLKEPIEKEFGKENVRIDIYPAKGGILDFPVQDRSGKIVSSLSVSQVLNRLPDVAVDYLFVNSGIKKDAKKWIDVNKDNIINAFKEGEDQ
jgi:uncharacterized protein